MLLYLQQLQLCRRWSTALYWLTLGHGYEITSIDVWGAYHSVLKAAEHLGTLADTKASIRHLVTQEAAGGFVRQVLGRELERS